MLDKALFSRMASQTHCLSCGIVLPVRGVGSFEAATCERCAMVHQRKQAAKLAPVGADAVDDVRRGLAALGLPTDAIDTALIEAARKRLTDVASADAAKAYRARATRREAALARVAQAALMAAAQALQAEHAAEPSLFTAEWGYPSDARAIGALNVPETVHDAACHVGTLRITLERTKR